MFSGGWLGKHAASQPGRQTAGVCGRRRGRGEGCGHKLWQSRALKDMTGAISENEYASGHFLITFLLLWPSVCHSSSAIQSAIKQHIEPATGVANACNLLLSQHKSQHCFRSLGSHICLMWLHVIIMPLHDTDWNSQRDGEYAVSQQYRGNWINAYLSPSISVDTDKWWESIISIN